MPADPQSLLEKIKALPADRVAEVEDFVEFIRQREQAGALTRAATAASAPADIVVMAITSQLQPAAGRNEVWVG